MSGTGAGWATITTSGGLASFPGLARPRTIRFDEIGSADVAALLALVDAARFFQRDEFPPHPRARDVRTYEITIEYGGRRRTLRVADPIADKELAALVRMMRRVAR